MDKKDLQKVEVYTGRMMDKKRERDICRARFDSEIKALKKKKKEMMDEYYKQINLLRTKASYWKNPKRCEYRKAYYRKNRARILARERDRILNSPEYRKKKSEYRHNYYLRRKAEGLYERKAPCQG